MASVRVQRSQFVLTSSAAADPCRDELFFFSCSLRVQWQRAPVDQSAICAGTDLAALFLHRILVHLVLSVFLSPLLFQIFCISHLLSATSPSGRPRGRPLVLAFTPHVLLPRGRIKEGTKSRGRETKKKKNSRLPKADGGWHWALVRRGQTHLAGNWVIISTCFVWDQRWAKLTIRRNCKVKFAHFCLDQTTDFIQWHRHAVNSTSSYTLYKARIFFVLYYYWPDFVLAFKKLDIVKEFFGREFNGHSGKTSCPMI